MSVSDRHRWMLAAAVAGVVAGIVPDAMGVAVITDPLSFETQHRSDTGVYLESRAQVTASGLRVGFQSSFGNPGGGGNFPNAGIEGVYFFKLPTLVAGETVELSKLSFSSVRDSASTGTQPPWNADLYAMGFETSSSPHSAPIDSASTGAQSNYAQSLFYVGPNQTGTGLGGAPIQKIQDNILTGSQWIPFSAGPSANALRTTNAQANLDLAAYIQTNLYGNNAFTSNDDFLLLRLNPDVNTYTTGNQRFQVSTNQTSTTTYTGITIPTLDMVIGSQWNKDDSVSVWSDSGSWTGTVPNATDRAAKFGAIISTAQTVNVDGAKTVAMLNFNNANSYTLAGSSITLSSVISPPSVTVSAGSHTISAPLILGSNTTFTVTPSDKTLTVSDLTATGQVLTKAGAGTLAVNNVRATSAVVSAGVLKTSAIANPTSSASVTPGVSNVNSLVVSGTGTVNLTNNRIVTNDAQGTKTGVTYNGIQGLVQTGRAGGAWNGVGINTDQPLALANQTAIGVATAAEAKGLVGAATTMWSGQVIESTDTLVMYTWAGDANLDGSVNADDYASIDLYSTVPGEGSWNHGDFNYDGAINADDYALIDSNVQNLGYVPYWTTDGARAAATAGLTAVPEPSTGLLLGIAAAGLFRRRRRI
jgi:hypothetical protein